MQLPVGFRRWDLAPMDSSPVQSDSLILGEFQRTLDDRYRLTVPGEFLPLLVPEDTACVLVKERPGCLSLWNASLWQSKFERRIELLRQRLSLGDFDRRLGRVQAMGRLLSSRHRPVQLAARGRLVVPEGFREFLSVEPGGEVMIVGAAVCVEIWNPNAWLEYLRSKLPKFARLFEQLS